MIWNLYHIYLLLVKFVKFWKKVLKNFDGEKTKDFSFFERSNLTQANLTLLNILVRWLTFYIYAYVFTYLLM